MKEQVNQLSKALVLGGGGSFAIGWELGYLSALSKSGIDLNDLDRVIGTSGGAQVAAGVTSKKSWQEIFNEQIEPKSDEEPPQQDMTTILEKYTQIAQKSKTPKEWLKNYSEYAIEPNNFDDSVHIGRLKRRIKINKWPENLMITAIDAQKAERVVFTSHSGVDIYRAMASSGSLPGVWPATTIDGSEYFDGGCHSMDNADLAIGVKKVLILSPNLPVVTPYSLEDAISQLKENGSDIKLITPKKDVFDKLSELGGNTVNTAIRPAIAELGRKQGERDSEMIKEFLKGVD